MENLPYKVADISLADFGRKEIDIAEKEIKLPESPFPAFDHLLYFREDSFAPAIRVRRGCFL